MAPGSVFLASRLGLPIVLLGLGYDRPWRVNTWDRFAIPRPHSRARGVLSPEIHVPPDLDRVGLEHFRVSIERVLTRLTQEAEAWAESGTRKLGQTLVRPGPARARYRRVDPAHVIGRPYLGEVSRAAAPQNHRDPV